jgi:threonine synthase
LIIPTGNLGHGVAAIYARAMGFPIGPIILATNANKTLSEWHRSGHYKPAPSIATIANAMDVGNPSNFERMIHLPPEQRTVDVALVDDEAIRVRIRSEFYRSNYVWCPHSAIAAEAYARLDEARRVERPWVVAATAHPFKFADVIRPIIGAPVAPPEMLARIIGRPVRKQPIKADLSALYATLEEKGRLAA